MQEGALPSERGKVRVRVRARTVVRVRLCEILRRSGDLVDEAVADEVVPRLQLPCIDTASLTTCLHALIMST